jgi:sulfatase modifying factor 1
MDMKRRAVQRMLGKAEAITLAVVLAGCGARTGLLDDLSAAAESSAASLGSTSSGSTFGSRSAASSASNAIPSTATGSSMPGSGPPPSCQPGGPGMTNCGPGGTGVESCCTSLEVTGGTFYRTYTNSSSGATGEADPATISSLRLDKYIVTVGRFRHYVNYLVSGGSRPPNGSGKHSHLNGGNGLVNGANPGTFETGWDGPNWNPQIATGPASTSAWNANLACDHGDPTWTNGVGTQENMPINCVSWYEAYAFCIWDGGFLPSEAEWEYGAAGGSQQREYPWGSTGPGTNNAYAIYGNYFGGTAAVGTAVSGSGVWGQLDLVGNVFEANLDWFASRYKNPCTDCANLTPAADLTPAAERMIRGGDYGSLPASLLSPSFFRGRTLPSFRSSSAGLRCARTP